MADFIAVIRRAVDGLTDNTPEMRARVYEKARAAVQRQLENMKPAPPADMLRRQLEKLDLAILQVEEEHAEALPPLTEPEVEADPVDAARHEPEPEPLQQEPVAMSEPEPAFQPEPVAPVMAEPVIATPVTTEPAHAQPVAAEPVAEPQAEDPLAAFLDSMPATPVRPASINTTGTEPVAKPDIGLPALEPIAVPPVAVAETRIAEPVTEQPQAASWPVEIDGEPDVWVDPDQPPARPVAETDPLLAALDPVAPAIQPPVAHLDPVEPVVAAEDADSVKMPKAAFDERDALADFGDLLAPVPVPGKKPAADFSWDAPFDDLPEPNRPAVFEQALSARQADLDQTQSAPVVDTTLAAIAPDIAVPPAPESQPGKPGQADPLAELDNLIGFNRKKLKEGKNRNRDDDVPADVTRAVSKLEGKSFRAQPRERGRGMAVIAFAVVIVALLAGAGAAVWMNQDKIMAFVDGLTKTATPATKTATTDTKTPAETPKETTTDQVAAEPDTKAADPAVTAVEEASEPVVATEDQPTEVASLEPTGPEKFTQRLLNDGTETVGDGSPVKVEPNLPEGRTESQQTDAGKRNDQVASADTAAATDSTATEKPAVVVAQKMFLYEERLGQGTPSALPGSVTWNVKSETNDSGKSEPVIEATLSVPDRKMTALITFKRNADPSLPASHIIELVFQLPKDFEGGNIESVDRVAMKQTEQDRGNALIAVPAKITDDFHMIALNDDKDAIANNTELLKTRSWIDIPITYRNGRRALITLEKGTTGTEAFEKAMREWAALGTAQAN